MLQEGWESVIIFIVSMYLKGESVLVIAEVCVCNLFENDGMLSLVLDLVKTACEGFSNLCFYIVPQLLTLTHIRL